MRSVTGRSLYINIIISIITLARLNAIALITPSLRSERDGALLFLLIIFIYYYGAYTRFAPSILRPALTSEAGPLIFVLGIFCSYILIFLYILHYALISISTLYIYVNRIFQPLQSSPAFRWREYYYIKICKLII